MSVLVSMACSHACLHNDPKLILTILPSSCLCYREHPSPSASKAKTPQRLLQLQHQQRSRLTKIAVLPEMSAAAGRVTFPLVQMTPPE